MKKFRVPKMKITGTLAALTMALAGGRIWGEIPYTPPTAGDLSCDVDTSAAKQADTVVSTRDGEGFYSIFDGTSFKGWWQDCKTFHSTDDRAKGAIWRVAPAQKAIYSNSRSGTGGILATHKRYANYEIMFDLWPTYGDDGGVFHRLTLGGQCFQTVMDYIGNGSFGGVWGEGGYVSRDLRQFMFSGDAGTLKIPGNGGADWTTFTKGMNPTSFGCSANGCTQADWRNLWDQNGWNTTRIQFSGGLPGQPKIRMRSWFLSKTIPRHWVPLWADSGLDLNNSQMAQWPVNPIGLQVHGGTGSWNQTGKGNWYKNIKVRPLSATGSPLSGPKDPCTDHTPGSDVSCATTSLAPSIGEVRYDVKSSSEGLYGVMEGDHEILIHDMRGKLVQRFAGRGGEFNYSFAPSLHGILLVELKSPLGIQSLRVVRP